MERRQRKAEGRIAMFRICFILTLVMSLFACSQSNTPPVKTPVAVQLKWLHQAQFAGYYAAVEKGYYASEGLDITFLQGGPDVDNLAPVVSHKAQFGVAGADSIIVRRGEEQPVRAIATIYQRSPIIFFALADSGISRPKDFIGKTIHIPHDVIPTFRAIMAKVGLSPDRYLVGNYGTDLTPFYSRKVHVWSGIINGKAAYNAKKDGHKIVFIYPDDYGIHFYGDTLFTNDDLITKNPDLIRRFLRATLKGWTYAVENPTSVAEIVAQYNPKADAQYETASMTASLPLINTGEDFIGWMKPEVWAGMEKNLREQRVLTKPVDIQQVYTLQFLQEVYQK